MWNTHGTSFHDRKKLDEEDFELTHFKQVATSIGIKN